MRKEIIGDCTLYCADMLDILPTLDKVDACITDPPYGIGEAGGKQGIKDRHRSTAPNGKLYGSRLYKTEDWDNKSPSQKHFDLIIKSCKYYIIWGGNYFTDKLPQGNHWFYWDKLQSMPNFSSGELAITNIKRNIVKKFTYMQNGFCSENGANDSMARVHPTQKPVPLMKWCVSMLPNDCTGTISDCFMGSGSTGVACAEMERKFIGIEKEPKYFDIACERIENAYRQGRLL